MSAGTELLLNLRVSGECRMVRHRLSLRGRAYALIKLRADGLNGICVFVQFLRHSTLLAAANQQAGPPLVLFCIAFDYLHLQQTLHLLEFCSLKHHLLFGFQKGDLTPGADHSLIEHRMGAEPACADDTALFAGQLVKETYE